MVFLKICLVSLIIAFSLVGCATTWMLPKSASEVNFETDKQTGWLSSYEKTQMFYNATPQTIFDAIKFSLKQNGFKIKKSDFQLGVVIGEHPITWMDWNSMAGVYFKQKDNYILVKVMIEGAKDSVIDITGHQQKYMLNIIGSVAEYLKSR